MLEIEFPYISYTNKDYVGIIDLFMHAYGYAYSSVDAKIEMGNKFILTSNCNNYSFDKKEKQAVSLVLERGIDKEGRALGLTYSVKKYATKREIEFLDALKQYFTEKSEDIEEELHQLGADIIKDGASWDVLAGYNDVKEAVRTAVILPFQHPEIYAALVKQTREKPKDIRPRAVLFYGPPGTGKTTMGKIIAKEMGKPFVYVPVETIFTCWYGESPRILDRVFDLAYKTAQNGGVLFIDEIDALAANRAGAHEETRKVISVLLTRLDGMKSKEGMVTIGTTNLIESLDSAVRRRFDEEIYFPLPSKTDREQIIKMYAKHLSPEDMGRIAEKTDGLSGSYIERLSRNVERSWAKAMTEKKCDGLPSVDEYLAALGKSHPDLANK